MGTPKPKRFNTETQDQVIGIKHSLADQKLPNDNANRSSVFSALITALVSSLILFIALFIAYWIIPWQKIHDTFFSLLSKEVSVDTGPLIYSPDFSPVSLISPSNLPVFEKATISTRLNSGANINELLQSHGFSKEESSGAYQAYLEISEKENITLKSGSVVEIFFTDDIGLSELTITLDLENKLKIYKSSSGRFMSEISKIKAVTKERIVVGSIESSFAASANKLGLSYDIVDDLVDIFSDRVSFHRDFRKGDRFTIIYTEQELVDGKKTTNGPILGAALEVRGQHLVAIRFVGADGKPRFFNEKGEEIGNTFLRFPLKFSKISSYFSTARFHPVLKINRPHHGVDFSAPIGTPVRSVASGMVSYAGRKGGHGVIVEIRHSARFTTGYSHLSSIAPGVRQGSKVEKGQLIGAVGMTGLATGPHLHFSLYDKGVYVDPLKTDLPQSDELSKGLKIGEQYLQRALFTLEHYQKIADSNLLQGGK